MAEKEDFIAVINDTNPENKGGSYNVPISGNNQSQFLGKKIGDMIDGIFVGEGESILSGYKLMITGGSDKTGTPMRNDLDGGARKSVLVTASTGYKGHKLVQNEEGSEETISATNLMEEKQVFQRKHNYSIYTSNQSQSG